MEERKVKKAISFDPTLINHKFTYIEVPGDPFAKQRPRATKKGRFITVYTPRETKNYEIRVRKEYNSKYHNIQLTGDLTVDIEGIFSIPKSISKKKSEEMIEGKVPHTKKPDCDNMAKVCLDALNGVAYQDDAFINKLNISKRYGENAMVKITIKENKEIDKE